MVQVHPGPPFKSPIHTRRFSLSPFGEYLSKNQFANYLPTLRLAGWHYTRGVKTHWVKAKRQASMRLCRESCPVTSKHVQGSAKHCKAVQGAGSHFCEFAGMWSVGSNAAPSLVRIPRCHGQFPRPLQRITRIRAYRGCLSTSTKCTFFGRVNHRLTSLFSFLPSRLVGFVSQLDKQLSPTSLQFANG